MKVQIVINIECGENTCASEPGKFCKYTGAKAFGTIPFCLLFQENLEATTGTNGEHGMGWLQRCNSCKEHSK
jgi:hypothetical protein